MITKMKIAIIGSSGFLGTKLMNFFSKEHKVLGTYIKNEKPGLQKLDATNKNDVEELISEYRPDVVIDTVALTSSITCEKNPRLCKTLNYTTAKNIADACKKTGSKMVFISSSYIFDGKKGDYEETDKPNPKNEYAKYKVLAEREVLNIQNSLVIRVDIMYGYNGKKEKNGVFGNSILREEEIKLKEPDQIRTPVFVEDVARSILFLTEKKQSGIFHVAGMEKMKMIYFLKNLEKTVRKKTKISVDDDKTQRHPVKIPFNATLNNAKIVRLGFKFGSFTNNLATLKKQYLEK